MIPVKLVTSTPDAEDLIVYMARVSNPTNQQKAEGSEKLIKYLLNIDTGLLLRCVTWF